MMKFLKDLIPIALLLLVIGSPKPASAQFNQTQKTRLQEILSGDPYYDSEVDLLEVLIRERGYDPYKLVYQSEAYYDRVTAQEKFVASFYALNHHDPRVAVDAVPLYGNSVVVNQGIHIIKQGLNRNLAKRKLVSPEVGQETVDQMFEILDLRGSEDNRLGLPFFRDFINTFQEPKWVGFATSLEERIDGLLQGGIETPLTLYDLALEITHHHADATKLLALLLSRDIRSDLYFAHFPVPASAQTVRTITRIPKLVRAFTDFLQWRGSYLGDRFSFPGRVSSASTRNQYFWTEAYLAQELTRAGLAAEVVQVLCTDLVNQYSSLRVGTQQVNYRLRWDLRFGIASMTIGGLAADLFAEVFLKGDVRTSVAYAVSFATGVLISRKIKSNAEGVRLQADQALHNRMSYRGAEFGIETFAADCNDTWAGRPLE